MSLIMFAPFVLVNSGWRGSHGASGAADVYYPSSALSNTRAAARDTSYCNVLLELKVPFKSIMGLCGAVR